MYYSIYDRSMSAVDMAAASLPRSPMALPAALKGPRQIVARWAWRISQDLSNPEFSMDDGPLSSGLAS